MDLTDVSAVPVPTRTSATKAGPSPFAQQTDQWEDSAGCWLAVAWANWRFTRVDIFPSWGKGVGLERGRCLSVELLGVPLEHPEISSILP